MADTTTARSALASEKEARDVDTWEDLEHLRE